MSLFAEELLFVPSHDDMVAPHLLSSPTPCVDEDDLPLLSAEIIAVHHHAQFKDTRYQPQCFVRARLALYSHKHITDALVCFGTAVHAL